MTEKRKSGTLRKGFTTGTYVAASVRAGVMFFETGVLNNYCIVKMPRGETEKIQFKSVSHNKEWIEFFSIKDAGDDPDITNGMEIIVRIKGKNDPGINIRGGKGIGKVTFPGLQTPVGEPAINPGPMKMIFENIKELMKSGNGYDVEIIFPKGEELAKQTFNPKLGIIGGLSILGTTGYVEPKSIDAVKKTISIMINMAISRGFKNIVFVPGNIGEKLCKNYFGIDQERIVQVSNYVGHAIKYAAEEQVKKIFICGHIGKLVKIAAGLEDTSSRVGDKRIETIIKIVRKMKLNNLAEMIETQCKTAENAAELILKEKAFSVFNLMAKMISENGEKMSGGKILCRSAIFNYNGELLGSDLTGNQILWWL
ncbi:MAG: cobalt-precorrin-5B (C(1))-methyltransferase CbiD [Actinobacteria bacterium]|nr:cobalt-precorrin-5B (C(1))-methyltransferase CbiD [Actinomycetota bacterium]